MVENSSSVIFYDRVQALQPRLFGFQKDKAVVLLILAVAGVEAQLVGEGVLPFQFEVQKGVPEFGSPAVLVGGLHFD